MKASISFYPNQNKRSKKTGRIPVYTRLCLNGAKAEERLSIDLTHGEFEKWDVMTMRIRDRINPANFILNNYDQRFQEFLILNTARLSTFNARAILDYVMGKNKVEETTIVQFVDCIFDQSIKNNSSLSEGTIRNYKKAINHLKAYLLYKDAEQMLLTQLTQDFAYEFKDYLLSPVAKYSKKSMTEVSAAYIIKKFRTIFDRAIDKNLIGKNYFKSLKLKTKSPRRERLNIDQVRNLYYLDCSKLPIQQIYRDIFLFSVFTGLANIDSRELKDCHLQVRQSGDVKLSMKRSKTSVFTECFLTSYAIQIINKYKNSPEHQISGFSLPHRSNKELNVQLKILASLCDIPCKLSSHIARHTFRQLLAEAGIEDIGVIKRMMGQSRSDAIDEVYYSITESRLLEARNRFESYLKINLDNGF